MSIPFFFSSAAAPRGCSVISAAVSRRRTGALAVAACMSLGLVACSSGIPKAPEAEGELVPVNTGQSLQELVRAAVAAARPGVQRFSATRGERLKDVLIRWARQDNARLLYQTTFNPKLIGAVDEPDVRAGGFALALLLQHESQGAVIDFSQPGLMVIKDFHTEEKP